MKYEDQTFDVRTVLCNNPGVPERVQTTARVRVAKNQARCWRVQLSQLVFAGFAVDPNGLWITIPTLARVTWGVDGVLHVADVDWPQGGSSFVVSGDFVQIDLVVGAAFTTDPLVGPPQADTSVTGGATITPDSGAPALSPTRTIVTEQLPPSGGAPFYTVAVPAYARAMRWHQISNTDPANIAPVIAFFWAQEPTVFNYITQGTVYGSAAFAFTTSERSWPCCDGITLAPLSRFLYAENRGALFFVSLVLEFVLDLA
jgi:hypothetical protein